MAAGPTGAHTGTPAPFRGRSWRIRGISLSPVGSPGGSWEGSSTIRGTARRGCPSMASGGVRPCQCRIRSWGRAFCMAIWNVSPCRTLRRGDGRESFSIHAGAWIPPPMSAVPGAPRRVTPRGVTGAGRRSLFRESPPSGGEVEESHAARRPETPRAAAEPPAERVRRKRRRGHESMNAGARKGGGWRRWDPRERSRGAPSARLRKVSADR